MSFLSLPSPKIVLPFQLELACVRLLLAMPTKRHPPALSHEGRRFKSHQLTHSERGCSPDGKKLIYVKEIDHGQSLWISNMDGTTRALVDGGMNLIPSWLPDSQYIVWMGAQPEQDPARKSQIHLMNTETGESRRLFSDPTQLQLSNSMPVVLPKRDLIAFVSSRSSDMRLWVRCSKWKQRLAGLHSRG